MSEQERTSTFELFAPLELLITIILSLTGGIYFVSRVVRYSDFIISNIFTTALLLLLLIIGVRVVGKFFTLFLYTKYLSAIETDTKFSTWQIIVMFCRWLTMKQVLFKNCIINSDTNQVELELLTRQHYGLLYLQPQDILIERDGETIIQNLSIGDSVGLGSCTFCTGDPLELCLRDIGEFEYSDADRDLELCGSCAEGFLKDIPEPVINEAETYTVAAEI